MTLATLTTPIARLHHPTQRIPFTVPVIWKSRAPVPVVTWKNRFLRSLNASSVAKIEKSLRTVTLRREQYLSEQEAKPEFVYFPETAVISHQKMLADGRTVEIALTGREGSVGVSSIFGSGILAASVQVAQGGVAVRIELEMLRRIMRIYPELIPLVVVDIGNYVNNISQHSICNTYHDLRQRLANWVLTVSDLSGASTLGVTHEQLARTLGVYRPSVTCTAVELRSEGLIEYSRGSVTIKDRARLVDTACPCYVERVMD